MIYNFSRIKRLIITLTSLQPMVETTLLNNDSSIEKRLFEICTLLEANVPHYNWVGFYFKNGNKKELKLATYVGEPTDHTIIPLAKVFVGK